MPKGTLGCDMCDLGRAVHFATISWEEVGHMTGTVRRVLCGVCFEREISSWDGRGGFAPEFVPPVVTAPVPRTLLGWPLGPFPRVESA